MRTYFLKTERIGFSVWDEGDLPLAQQLWGDGQVTRYICAAGAMTDAEIQARLEKEIANQAAYGVQYWPVFAIETGEFLGCCGLRPYRLEDGVYEIGFHLRSVCWGKGLGTEAARAVIGYAFEVLKATELFAGHHPENAGSAKMLGKLGFAYTHDEFYPPTGLEHPSYRMGRL